MSGWLATVIRAAAVIASIFGEVVSNQGWSRGLGIQQRSAVVDSDGHVLQQCGFAELGLHVQVSESTTNSGKPSGHGAEYRLTFDRQPSNLEVTPVESALARLRQGGPREYVLRFIGTGFGNPMVRSSFWIRAS